MYENSNLVLEHTRFETKTIGWRSPSNIAIVKYWGKFGVQQPRNPSISFTLDQSYTDTTVSYRPKSVVNNEIALDFYFENEEKPAFRAKIVKFLASLQPIFPFIRQLEFTIRSHNSFPHSAGIASSASSMSALAMCLCSIEKELFGTLTDEAAFLQKASFIARLGSGSACRSIYPVAAMWGELEGFDAPSNLYAVPMENEVHDIFKTYQNSILIASRGEKPVSSRAGHALMEGNIYAENRYEQARNRCTDLAAILKSGELDAFGELLEDEALTLHALMMCSKPSYMLMRPNSLAMIEKVRAYREDTKQPLYFTLDAGPNLHLLYPDHIKTDVEAFINSELVSLCEKGEWIADKVGKGVSLIRNFFN
jgi:diphosphomevalonate decarboxylase